MILQDIKNLYISKEQNIDNEIKEWCKDIDFHGINTEIENGVLNIGEFYWPFLVDFTYELIKLLAYTENYDKLNLYEIELLLENDKEIQKILSQVKKDEFKKLNFLFSSKENVKKQYLDYMKKGIKDKIIDEEREIKYREECEAFKNIEFVEFNSKNMVYNGTYYETENIKFHDLKVYNLSIFKDLKKGLHIIDIINEQYKNTNFKELCAEVLIEDKTLIEDWEEDDLITSKEDALYYLSDEANISISHEEYMEIDFMSSPDIFGGHGIALILYPGKEQKEVCIW